MTATILNSLIATALLLSAPSLLDSADVEVEIWDSYSSNATDCLPNTLPQGNPNASSVTLQMHQWIWIENLTAPDYAPRTQVGSMFYEIIKPGYVRQQTLSLLSFGNSRPVVYINVSFVTNGDTLCAAAVTEFRNRSSGSLDRVSCSQVCHNFSSLGSRARLPLLVLDDWNATTRYSEYLVFDSVDPDSRASYTCTGLFKLEQMSNVPSLLSGEKRCPQGDECVFNYDNLQNLANAGCKSDFREYVWCVSDMNLCSYNINGICPVCCRGDLCNRAVAQKAYERWLAARGNGSAPASRSSPWMLALVCVILFGFKFRP